MGFTFLSLGFAGVNQFWYAVSFLHVSPAALPSSARPVGMRIRGVPRRSSANEHPVPSKCPARHNRHVACRSHRRVRLRTGVDSDYRRACRAWSSFHDCHRACAAHRTVTRIDPDRPDTASTRLPKQQRLHNGAGRTARARRFSSGGVSNGRVHLGISSRPTLRVRSGLRHLRRSFAEGKRSAANAIRRAVC